MFLTLGIGVAVTLLGTLSIIHGASMNANPKIVANSYDSALNQVPGNFWLFAGIAGVIVGVVFLIIAFAKIHKKIKQIKKRKKEEFERSLRK